MNERPLILTGDSLDLRMHADGSGVTLEDRKRNVVWRLDQDTRKVYRDPDQAMYQGYTVEAEAFPLGSGEARLVAGNTIEVAYRTPAGELTLRWIMESDHVRILAEASGDSPVAALTFPGAFLPDAEDTFKCAVPNGQGILHTGKGPAFSRRYFGMGSEGFALSMFGQIAGRGSLLTITETDTDAVLQWRKTEQGAARIQWLQIPSFGTLAYPREVVLFTAPPDLTALCKQYRAYEIEKGRFRTWDEKIAARPALAELFGAAIVFLGYPEDTELDYEAGFRALKAAGIDKAFVYPVYHHNSIEGDFAGKPMDIRHLVPCLHELGYLAGSFIYTTERALGPADDPYRDVRLDRSEQPSAYWEMEGIKWYSRSLDDRLNYTGELLEREHSGLDGVHFDTLTCRPFVEDYHPGHRNDTRDDDANRRELLDFTAARGMVISSEGFWGRAASHYDLANTKYMQALGGEEYCVVPMTMLVYHDSAYHTWWEVDNYNNPEHRSQYSRGYTTRFPWGGGSPRLQSAMDALMGTPPDIYPFGTMWNLIPHTRDLYFYKYRLEDARVQEALPFVRRVMDLNARIGKLEMVEHRLHTDEGAVQETVFSDGTRVVANFANLALEAPGIGLVPAESWSATLGSGRNLDLEGLRIVLP